MSIEEKKKIITDYNERNTEEYLSLEGSELIVNKEYTFSHRTHRVGGLCNKEGIPESCCGAGHFGCIFTTLAPGAIIKIEKFQDSDGVYPGFIVSIGEQKFAFLLRKFGWAVRDRTFSFIEKLNTND